jgi:HD-GYP domain-containing protein (c-di-GMP phosphodiesterase class II)
MELAEPVYGPNGQLLLQPGVNVTDRYIDHLRKLGLPAVYIADPDTADIVAPRPVRTQTRQRARTDLGKVMDRIAPNADELRQLSLAMTHEHAGTDRFARAVRSAFGGDEGLDDIGKSVDALMSDLLHADVLAGLGSIKCHDAYTYQHSIDVTIMGIVLARKAGWDDARVRTFGIGCLLHDVGKVLVPAEILNKPGKLSAEEFEQVKKHPFLGYQLIKALMPESAVLVPQVAYQHHERQNGKGYPRGLSGTNVLGEHQGGKIHDFGALCAVADVYDAMSSCRPYRAAWLPDRVAATVATLAGQDLNAQAVELFMSVVAPYPMCSEVVVLSGPSVGCRGVVAKVSPQQVNRPVIRILHNGSGERMEPIEIDLAAHPDVQICSFSPASNGGNMSQAA